MAEKKPGHNRTSREVRDRWDSEHLIKYTIYMRTDKDTDIISAINGLLIDGYKITDVFRTLIRAGFNQHDNEK